MPSHSPAGAIGRRRALGQALHAISYEVLPFRNTEESVLAHVPRTVPLTITTTEAKGLAPTIDLAVRLTGHGYSAAPHLAARLVRDKQQLTDIVARLREAGVEEVFVIGGDAPEPAGPSPTPSRSWRRCTRRGTTSAGSGSAATRRGTAASAGS
ncbi:hypothetical protein [Thermocatellispora tengchongensis]|uniref:hypothetical protein n=1 Tax=Thermocatellispora tengchongensis TaxID=1073253 RepID=UPI00363C66D6